MDGETREALGFRRRGYDALLPPSPSHRPTRTRQANRDRPTSVSSHNSETAPSRRPGGPDTAQENSRGWPHAARGTATMETPRTSYDQVHSTPKLERYVFSFAATLPAVASMLNDSVRCHILRAGCAM
jgi:hypothetical protein